VTLYSAIPVRISGEVIGAVLVSQSTADIHASLDEVRLGIFKVVLASVGVAVLLSLLVSQTIARPLRRLRREATSFLDRRGRIKGRFTGSNRPDEIGDLARSLEELSSRLEEKIGFIESFAADVSHEFKNPLASIRNATELLAEVDDPEERRRFFDVAQSEIARMEKLLSTVKEITLIDARLDEEQVSAVGLKEVLLGTVEGVRSRDERDVRFVLDLPEEEALVQAAPERLVQVFENILDNAVSFSPPGGTIDVRLQTNGGAATVTIHDQGPGFPLEHEGRIFTRFFSYRPDHVKSASPAKTKHVGLGLAIAKAIVEGYGGRIAAETDPGRGATFSVQLQTVGT
jgi:two-component system sensor histidine kinase ChvG